MIYRFFIIVTLLLFFTEFNFSQTTEDLKSISVQESVKFWNLKKQADSLAKIQNIPIRKEFSNGRIIELQRFEDNIPIYYETHNLNAAKTVSTFPLWIGEVGGYNLSGNGIYLGVWDGGNVRWTHQEFQGRVTIKDGYTTISDHATHVAGTMVAAGIRAEAKGMSYAAQLHSYEWNNDLSEMATAANAGLRISNHSYGQIVGFSWNYFNDNLYAWFGDTTVSEVEDYRFGFYDTYSSNWDNVAFNAPYYLIVKSAGNDRGDGPTPGSTHWVRVGSQWVKSKKIRQKDGGDLGYDCVGPQGIAKNILTVGAVNDIPNGYRSPSDVVMSSFSSWGPADDGRIKPDIVANGVGLTSSVGSADNAYASYDGTSMATPNVSGSLGLIQQFKENKYGTTIPWFSSTYKALVIHTADEAGSSPGPDYKFGWGLLNTYKAVSLMQLDVELGKNQLIREFQLQNNNSIEFVIQSSGKEPLKVTICWIDKPRTALSKALNPRTPHLVNDLDLRVYGPNQVEFYPWVLDYSNPNAPAQQYDNTIDNVEQVFIANPIAGNYTVRITHKGTLDPTSIKVSAIISGVTLPDPSVPTLLYPKNDSIGVPISFMFRWDKAPYANKYEILIAKDSNFTNLVYRDTNIIYQGLTYVGLSPNTYYYWKVRAKNNYGISNWSSTYKFKTSLYAPTKAPELLSPATNSTNIPTKPTLIWSFVEGATHYRLQLSTSLLFTSSSIVVDTIVADTTYYQSTDLQTNKKYYWRVLAKNSAGESSWSSIRNFTTAASVSAEKEVSLIPDNYSLEQNYPNPFNPTTYIKFALPEKTKVKLTVSNILGQVVAVLIDEELNAGYYLKEFDATKLSSGIYLYKLETPSFVSVKKMSFIK